jgi:SAM-dependent methyltransferase
MQNITPAILAGHYARKQLAGSAWLMTWSHRRRFALAQRLTSRYRGRRLLDYGCGDGTLLALLCNSEASPATAVGAELDTTTVEDCRSRLGGLQNLSFVTIPELAAAQPGSFDAIVCTEVLEHAVERAPIFELWQTLLAPGGELLISVPNETGPALAVKQTARRVAGWFRVGDYEWTIRYSWRDFLRGLTAGRRQHMTRPVHRSPDGRLSHCHTGFNWRALREELSQRWTLRRTYRSPLPLVPVDFNSQIWFLLSRP